MLSGFVRKVVEGGDLSRDEAAAAMRELIGGEASPALAAALLTALRLRGETPDLLAGFASAMREHATPLLIGNLAAVDTCGTGGGAVATFNISTTAAFVAAGAGAVVAKHGNRAVTSACGSADVLEALGVPVGCPPAAAAAALREVGMAFLFAPAYHPAMRHVGPIRRELPFRTVFNCLGPLANPAGVRRQMIGVYEERLVPLLAGALRSLGVDCALVVHGAPGMDELSTLGPTRVAEVRGDEVREYQVSPGSLGLPAAEPADLSPAADAAAGAVLVENILRGEAGPRRDVAALNAAAALYAAGIARDLSHGLELAAASIDSGRAAERLEAVRRFDWGRFA